jgi:hypothetical protein
MKYTFINIQGREATVTAQTEWDAREQAMHAFWGPPDNYVTFHPYKGQGLIVTREEED